MLVNSIWRIFEKSGSIEAYLYYKEFVKINNNEIQNDIEAKGESLIGEKLLQGF